MTSIDPIQSYTKIRRKERATDEAWIRSFLKNAPFGTLATEWQGQPFATPVNFVFDEAAHAIYFHKAPQGRLLTNLAANPRACLCAAEMGRLLPGDKAKEFGVEYASAIAFGRVTLVTDEDEARRGLQLLLNKYSPHLKPGKDYRPITPEELRVTAVLRLDIAGWSGKEEPYDPDHPGAFFYGEQP